MNFLQNYCIQICGGIASGKTTFATLLKKNNIDAIFENFEINPFWQAFYSNPTQYAFETELTFLLQHYHQIKLANSKQDNFVCDFSPILDLAYANVTLNNSQREAFLSVYRQIKNELPNPSLLIYLRCNPSVELERIKNRGRSIEQSINIEFLSQLNQSLEKCVSEIANKVNVIDIDSDKQDFVNDDLVKHNLLKKVEQELSGCNF
ncbi:MAG: deoxynucleoside kinase [Xenococcaceae cyanobacterium MO_167.B27]|nr:deoxynucleoside kinase [Xenococcaceae cyanobacterium MO_167.B27]